MSIFENSNVVFEYAGLFESKGMWIHPERVEKTYELIYVIRGEVFLQEGQTPLHAQEGDVLLLSPGIRHFGTIRTQNVRFYWVHFHLKGVELPFEQRFFQHLESSALFKELLHYNNLPVQPVYLVNTILLHILGELYYLSQAEENPGARMTEAVYEWLRIHATAEMTVEKAAAHFGFSPDHLSRMLKQQYGMSAGKIINRFLMNEARKLLCNTDRYVKEIAADLEFSSDKAFIAFFKYHEGCFPTAFRRRFSKVHMNCQ